MVDTVPIQDGIWLVKNKDGTYFYTEKERGIIYKEELFKSLIEVAKYFSKLKLSRIPKYNKLFH
ncbi:hypothetical protein [Pseudofulvibacter geojedonensis]|uniref:Uncharacterized protein n=1 Tax=Pseudofulvibacter geojedonensis TaxID=1123758 RepID=A0ABW3I1N4_9FLAO